MCGLAGSYQFEDFDLEAALDAIQHRGPDGRGTDQQGGMRHGHVRLALLDLSPAGAQPFRYRGGLLSFNGEIWNWLALREELRARGHRFQSSCDTEVLAAALWEWGQDALPRLEGMFGFAWTKGGSRWLARDRFGKVPLYVHRSARGWAWASERKGLGGLPARMLAPATLLDLSTGRISAWYSVPERSVANAPPEVLLETGVERRLVADAPLCCLVSGGLDSALLLTLAKRLKPDIVAFTAALRGRSSPDLQAARRLCEELGVPLREVWVEPPSSEALRAAARAIEIPMKAQVEIAALCIPLARAISAEGFKACLSGEAADELFAGYGSIKIGGWGGNDDDWRAIRRKHVRKMARGNFIRCNKAFMAAGVECRLPYMERSLVEAALAMGKAECPPGKKALKWAAERVGVPAWVIRRRKETFQGGAGLDDHAAQVLRDPGRFYRETIRQAYGESALERGQ